MATLALLERFGYSNLTPEVLLQASPVSQSLNRRFASAPVSNNTRRRITGSIQGALNVIQAHRAAGDTRSPTEILFNPTLPQSQDGALEPGQTGAYWSPSGGGGEDWRTILRVSQDGGFANVDEMFDAELKYREQVPVLLEQSQARAKQFRDMTTSSLSAQQAALDSLSAVSDIGALKQAELARLKRDIADQEQMMLRAASVGDYNPAGGLEGLTRINKDADLIALERAIALAAGETSVAGSQFATAKGADPVLAALGLAPSIAGARAGSPSYVGGGDPANTSLGAGIAGASNTLGQAIIAGQNQYATNQLINQYLNRSAGSSTPAYSPSTSSYGYLND
jgi:hypothetical protein